MPEFILDFLKELNLTRDQSLFLVVACGFAVLAIYNFITNNRSFKDFCVITLVLGVLAIPLAWGYEADMWNGFFVARAMLVAFVLLFYFVKTG